jgi:hypothetical protein
MSTENKVLEPTMNFRWLRFISEEVYGDYCMVLQQAWKDNEGHLEWRDISIENREGNQYFRELANFKFPVK